MYTVVSILAVTYICTCEFEQPDKLKLAGIVLQSSQPLSLYFQR